MSNWFDDRARSAAQREAAVSAAPKVGISRRRMLQRTAVVGGAAWVAPTLISAARAWAASCGTGETSCGTQCCSAAQFCAVNFGISVCSPRTGLGSICLSSASCETQYACSAGLCKIPSGSTLTCTLNVQCVSNNCNPRGKCVSNQAAGATVNGQVDGKVSVNSVPEPGVTSSVAPTQTTTPAPSTTSVAPTTTTTATPTTTAPSTTTR